MNLIGLAENRLLPDSLVRKGIRRLLKKRLKNLAAAAQDQRQLAIAAFAAELRNGPLAVETDAANAQHYEVPAEFFELMLGPRLKYSSCLFETPQANLAAAEEAMLRLTCERAEICSGMRVLELGCGWGSLTLWIAEHFPQCEVTAVSNSASQRSFIEGRARKLGLANVRVLTADMREFDIDQQFDRVVSVEMFEHMRNYELLFQKISRWLHPGGKMFAHVFCHRESPYAFESEGSDNWMGRHFFTGGIMPSQRLFHEFDRHLSISRQWSVCGLHYWQTCEAWLRNLDENPTAAVEVLVRNRHIADAKIMLQRWRMFLLACAELFRYREGQEWFVEHYLFEPRTNRVSS